MYSLSQTELSCSRCGRIREHTVLRSGEAIVRSLCNTCGQLGTAAPAVESHRSSQPDPHPAPPVFPFGQHVLGGGLTRIEGPLTTVPGPVGPQCRAAVAEAKVLADAGAHFFRLEVKTKAHLTLIRRVKEATGLPVVADLGRRAGLVREALGAGANGLGFALRDAAEAKGLLAPLYGGPRVPLFITVSPPPMMTCNLHEAAGALAKHAADTIAPLQAAGHDLIVLNMPSTSASAAREAYRQLRQDGRILLRLTHPPADITGPADPIAASSVRADAFMISTDAFMSDAVPIADARLAGSENPAAFVQHALALTQWLQADVVDVLAVNVGGSVQSVEIARAVADVTREAHPHGPAGMAFSRVQVLDYLVRKAIYRVATKPLRIVHQWESDPRFVVRSLPTRVMTKPTRMLRELRRAARRIG